MAAQWFIRPSSDPMASFAVSFGASGGLDASMPADYDGDGRADIATFRADSDLSPGSADWFIRPSSDPAAGYSRSFGASGGLDVPVPADYDGDGRDDIAAFDRLLGEWRTRPLDKGDVTRTTFGPTGRRVVPVLASIVDRLDTIEAGDDSESTAARRVDHALASLDRSDAIGV